MESGKSSYHSILSTVKSKSTLLAFLVLAFLNIALVTHALYRPRNASLQKMPPMPTGYAPPATPAASTNLDESQFIKPENLTISGLVFFGRRDRVKSMSCYMEVRTAVSTQCPKYNRVDHGGLADG
jgi:hypothetical protein